jgi:catechol 2,3-dioxygenase-like lactoylglutathione lyase family enzyme
MTVARVVPILKVTDLPASLEFYARLGFVVDFRYAAGPGGPWYAGASLDRSCRSMNPGTQRPHPARAARARARAACVNVIR